MSFDQELVRPATGLGWIGLKSFYKF